MSEPAPEGSLSELLARSESLRLQFEATKREMDKLTALIAETKNQAEQAAEQARVIRAKLP